MFYAILHRHQLSMLNILTTQLFFFSMNFED